MYLLNFSTFAPMWSLLKTSQDCPTTSLQPSTAGYSENPIWSGGWVQSPGRRDPSYGISFGRSSDFSIPALAHSFATVDMHKRCTPTGESRHFWHRTRRYDLLPSLMLTRWLWTSTRNTGVPPGQS